MTDTTCAGCNLEKPRTLALPCNPEVSLSLENLKAATPPRDTLDALVSYIRHPLSYDGSDENFACREVSPNWIPQAQVEQMAAFILRAAEKAPGWGSSKF